LQQAEPVAKRIGTEGDRPVLITFEEPLASCPRFDRFVERCLDVIDMEVQLS
jgi:hypothetical protein